MEFQEASEKVKSLSKRPDNDTLLKLYGLFKQGSVGDVQGKRPGMLDIKGRAKYDAWAKLSGLSQDEAKNQYVSFVEELIQKDQG